MITKTIELYKPHDVQFKMHNSKARFRVGAFGRQSGKSTWAINELLKTAWENPGTIHWFISPTHEQAKIQYRRLVGMLWPCREVMLKKNQTELRVKLINQAEISFKSGEVADNLRGATLNSVIIDEVRDQPSHLWSMIVRPMLATTNGRASFISTPNGFDGFYDLAQMSKLNPDWETFQAPSTCNPLFTDQEANAARQTMSEAVFAQEILAEFRDLTAGKAYINFGNENKLDKNPFCTEGKLINEYLPIHIGLDFNLSPMAWTLAQKKGNHIHFFDEIFLEGSHTQEATKVLIDKVRGHKLGVVLVGDATGKAGQRAAAGQSDYDILCQMLDDAGIKWLNLTPESNPGVKDRVNTVNARLKSATNEIHITVNPNTCPRLTKDFERVSWKQGSGGAVLDQTTDHLLTHASDGAGYLICQVLPIDVASNKPGLLSVIIR
jgi:hypothetical protein